MATRKSTGKRLRFSVFERDHFTCQYCGAQPPNVVLVVDHITAVANGGESTSDNLVTCCEPCNQGKGARELGYVAPRPDADLLYLAMQQEIAEIRRYQESLRQRDAAVASAIAMLQEVWINTSGVDWHPSDVFLRQLLNRYPIDVAGAALTDVAGKVGGGYSRTRGEKWTGYLYAMCQRMAQEGGEK